MVGPPVPTPRSYKTMPKRVFSLMNSLTCKMETLGRGEAILQAIYAFVVVFYAVIGTLRPDLIESASSLASSKADAIKTHHNDTELVRNLRAKVSAQKSSRYSSAKSRDFYRPLTFARD